MFVHALASAPAKLPGKAASQRDPREIIPDCPVYYSLMCRTKLALGAVLALPLCAGDWPQFLGPTRNGVYPGSDISASWPASGPPLLWKRDAAHGFSAPVVSQGRLIFFYRQGAREIVEALDAKTGKNVWTFDYPTSYRDDFGFDEGPRAAPAIAGGKVFTFGAEIG